MAVATLFAAFLLMRLAPGDPAQIRLLATGGAPSVESLAFLRDAHGLEQPLGAQFLDWLQGLARGDAGRSIASDRPILPEVAARLPWSFAIGTIGLAIAFVGGGLLGYAAALRPHGTADRTSRLLTVAAQGVPAFAFALLLFWLFATSFQIVRPLTGNAAERLIGPIAVVALFSMGTFARVCTDALRRAETTGWFLTAQAKGLSRAQAMRRHASGPALLALLAVLVPELGWAIGGTAVVELVFGVPGLSAYVVEAASARDYAVMQIYLLTVLAWLGLAMVLARLIERRIDPRESLEGLR